MADDNSEQIAEWNGTMGQQWATRQSETDAIVLPFGVAALAAAAAQAGERVIDVGCGCGDTSITLAGQVGQGGAVLGVDVSQPMLDVARARAAQMAGPQLSFRVADAAEATLPAGIDLLYSRFGVMFFSQPGPAFAHLRKSLRAGGRCVFVCWRTPRDNSWAMTPLLAARQAVPVTPVPADPLAPGPFAFADEDRLRGILSGAGFGDIRVQRFDAAVSLGATPQAATERVARIGPVSRFMREAGDLHRAAILAAVESSLVPFAAADGSVSLNGSSWIVSASSAG